MSFIIWDLLLLNLIFVIKQGLDIHNDRIYSRYSAVPLTSASTRWMCSFRFSFIVCCSLTVPFISLRQLLISAVCFDRAWSQRTIRLRKSCKLVTWWTSILPTAEFVPITAMSLLRISSSRVYTETDSIKKKIKLWLLFVLYSIFTSLTLLSLELLHYILKYLNSWSIVLI